jgi:hypothetical protein
MTDEQRRLTFLRDNVEHLQEEKSALETLANALKTSSEDEVTNIINQLRSGPDVHSVALSLRGRGSFSEPREGSVLSTGCEPTINPLLAKLPVLNFDNFR